MTLDLTPEQIAAFRAGARRREEKKRQALAERHQRAWQVVQRAARMLKEQYGAESVVVFGSVLTPKRFHERSDVDLAVWGLDERLYYKVVSRLLDLDATISVDLVEAETARPRLRVVIEEEGVVVQ